MTDRLRLDITAQTLQGLNAPFGARCFMTSSKIRLINPKQEQS